MPSLEQKLKELGYESIKDYYVKSFGFAFNIYIAFNTDNKPMGWVKEMPLYMFTNQQEINNLQQAFNEMQKDLKILKEIEDGK